MNGNLPVQKQIVGMAFGGILLAIVLIGIGVNNLNITKRLSHSKSTEGTQRPPVPAASDSSLEKVATSKQTEVHPTTYAYYTVVGASVLNIRARAPFIVNGRWRLGRDIGNLAQGTKVRKTGQVVFPGSIGVWYEVEVVDRTSAKLRGWVKARYLRKMER